MEEIKLKSNPEITIYRQETIEDILLIMFDLDSVEDLEDVTIGGEDVKTGENIKITYKELKNSIQLEGCYGISDPDSKSIFVWVDFNIANPVLFFNMIGHELGHLEEPYLSNDTEEEMKANLFGEVSSNAFEIYNALKP